MSRFLTLMFIPRDVESPIGDELSSGWDWCEYDDLANTRFRRAEPRERSWPVAAILTPIDDGRWALQDGPQDMDSPEWGSWMRQIISLCERHPDHRRELVFTQD